MVSIGTVSTGHGRVGFAVGLGAMVGSKMEVCEASMEMRPGILVTTLVLSMGVISVGEAPITFLNSWSQIPIREQEHLQNF